MRERKYVRLKKVVWWTDELKSMKQKERRCRRVYQRARRGDRDRIDERLDANKGVMREYKSMIERVKEENWK